MIGLFGGAFDPPHNGHVALVRAAKRALGVEPVLVLVAADPAHKRVETPASTRLELTRAAFPGDEVLLDEHAVTIDTLRAHPEWSDPVFLLGADEFRNFLSWREPDEILRRARLGVASRPGFPRSNLESVLAGLGARDRVLFFDLEVPIASRTLRGQGRLADDVPPAVAEIIEREGLYRADPGYTEQA